VNATEKPLDKLAMQGIALPDGVRFKSRSENVAAGVLVAGARSMAPREPWAQLAEPGSALRGWAASRYFQTGSKSLPHFQSGGFAHPLPDLTCVRVGLSAVPVQLSQFNSATKN
jgi:hypothetical protein